MRNIHWFPIYVHLSRLTHLSKSRSLMAVTLDVSKRPICFVSRGPLCHWNESDYQLLNINSNLLIIGDRWFSSFNKSERVKIAHYLVRNLAGSWSQDKKKKHCPFAPLRLPNPPHSTSLKKTCCSNWFLYTSTEADTQKKNVCFTHHCIYWQVQFSEIRSTCYLQLFLLLK